MGLMRIQTIIAAAFALIAPVQAADSHFERWADLAGDWRGELAYLDYSSGERQAIGMAAVMEVTPDNGFVISRARYTDPGFDVFILTVSTIDAETGAYRESYHRGGNIETFEYTLKSADADNSGWVYVFEDESVDDDRPALIRRTFSLQVDTYRQVKEVDFLDDAKDGDFLFRNEVVLTRSDENVSFEDFRRQD